MLSAHAAHAKLKSCDLFAAPSSRDYLQSTHHETLTALLLTSSRQSEGTRKELLSALESRHESPHEFHQKVLPRIDCSGLPFENSSVKTSGVWGPPQFLKKRSENSEQIIVVFALLRLCKSFRGFGLHSQNSPRAQRLALSRRVFRFLSDIGSRPVSAERMFPK